MILKNMFLIKFRDQKYWVDKYDVEKGWFVFSVRSKDGVEYKHRLNVNNVEEIIEMPGKVGEYGASKEV